MSTTEDLSALQGYARPEVPTRGVQTRVWAADVVAVNPDGTVDCQPVAGRATKVGMLVPGLYKPQVGDRVLATDLNGDPRIPIVLQPFTVKPPSVTGSRGGNAALASLLSGLANLGVIENNTTA